MSSSPRQLAPWVGLLVLCLLVRPVWRALDPWLAARVAVLEGLRRGEVAVDPWGTAYERRAGLRDLVLSWGPDRAAGTEDDILIGYLAIEQPLTPGLGVDTLGPTLPGPYRRPWLAGLLPGAALLALTLGRRAVASGRARRRPWLALGAGLVAAAALTALVGQALVGPLPWQPWEANGNARAGLLLTWPPAARPALERADRALLGCGAALWASLAAALLAGARPPDDEPGAQEPDAAGTGA